LGPRLAPIRYSASDNSFALRLWHANVAAALVAAICMIDMPIESSLCRQRSVGPKR